MDRLLGLAEALERSEFGTWARESATAYPAANLMHLLGLVLLVGGIGLLDLRLAGFFRRLPLIAMSRALTPLALAGLALMAISGPVLFAADAGPLARSETLRWKLALIGIALANAVVFRLLWRDRLESWDVAAPALGRIMAAGSILLWLAVAALGRLIAYS